MQAARGTPLSDGARAAGSRGRGTLRLLLASVAVGLYALDQVTKALAVDRLSDGDVSVVGQLLVLHLVRNPGAAFSAGTQFTVALSCIAVVAVVVVLIVSLRAGSRLWALALGLLLAGIAGNLTDRLLRPPGPLRGHVVDFLMLPHWPVFNVADMCINVGAVLILIQAFRGIRLNGARLAESGAGNDADAVGAGDAPESKGSC